MSRFLAILFVFIMSAQAAHQGLIYAYYVLNKDYIAQNLCENKAKPELKCDGKCHLKQVLSISQKEPSPEQPVIPQLEEIKSPVLYCEDVPTSSSVSSAVDATWVQNISLFRYFFAYNFKFTSLIFHPPQ